MGKRKFEIPTRAETCEKLQKLWREFRKMPLDEQILTDKTSVLTVYEREQIINKVMKEGIDMEDRERSA